jgi:protocatechuate 3,4-dioxygenase beta subunit
MNALRLGNVALALALAAAASAQSPAQGPAADNVTVTGRAIDADGKPVAGCAVGVFGSNHGFDTAALLARPLARTDENGRYRVTAPKNGYHVLVVATKGHQVCVQRLHTDQRDAAVMLDALMLPATTLRGRVRDAAAAPIAGALVRVEDPLTAGAMPDAWFESQAVTDAHGIFEVPGVPRTGLRVSVHALGFDSLSRLAAHDSPLDVQMEPTGVVRGRVVDADGKPVADAQVYAATAEQRASTRFHATDADGRFELSAPRAHRFRIAANEQRPPHRSFASVVLRAPQDDVVVTTSDAPRDGRQVTVRCVDAATKAPIARFHASWSSIDSRAPGTALLFHPEARRPFDGEAAFALRQQPGMERAGAIVVDAPGFGFAVADVPAAGGLLVVELPAERVLTGVVTDAVTGAPAVGAAVRPLPVGSSGGPMGGGPDPWRTGATTDAAGRYRIGGLAAGEYAVQVYGAGRHASDSRRVTVAAGADAALDLEMPKPAPIEIELTGDVPERCLGCVVFGSVTTMSTLGGSVDVDGPLPPLPHLPLAVDRVHELGPVGRGEHRLAVRLPSRLRLGSALLLELGSVRRGQRATLRLPDLRQLVHHGRVRLPAAVPRERVAVAAHCTDGAGARAAARFHAMARGTFCACLDSDGAFAFELPPGRYALQLIDLETGLVFHTESEDHEVFGDARPSPIELTPNVRWLTIDLAPANGDAPVVLQSLSFTVGAPRDGLPASLRLGMARNDEQTAYVPCPANQRQLRWLVPQGRLRIAAHQTFGMLVAGSGGWQAKPVDSAEVAAGIADVRVTLTVPAPPGDDELVQPPAK